MGNTTSYKNQTNDIFPYLALISGILALSFSAMFVRWANAPGPVTGLYRVFLSTLILTPIAARRGFKKGGFYSSTLVFPILAGLFTAGDLALWNTSILYTTAANAALLGNTAPFWVALGAWLLFREKLTPRFWLGLGLTLAGATLILGPDFIMRPRLGIGDLMAIGAGIFYAGYFLSTQRSRAHYPPLMHIWLMGISASLGLFVINIVLKYPLIGYSSRTWLVFWGTALVSQIIGYTSMTYALGHLPASVVAPTMIGQPITTALLAIPLLGEVPPLLQFAGGMIALTGIYMVNQSNTRSRWKNSHLRIDHR